MLTTILIISLAFVWLLLETRCLTIRLTGDVTHFVDTWTPYYKELLARDNRPHNISRTRAEWDIYNEQHKDELEQEYLEREREQEERRLYRARHECKLCVKTFENPVIETMEFKYGNSTCHVAGCHDCLEKYRKAIEKSQDDKIRQPIQNHSKPSQPPLFITTERVGSHREWIETSPKHGYHRTIDDFETIYHDCLVSKTWLKEHEHFEYPEPSIDITIDGKTLPVNGNYKKGLIAGFMEQYTTRVRAGKKTMTIVKGGHVENRGFGCYVAVNGEMVDGTYKYYKG
jgi:hypothetical protein